MRFNKGGQSSSSNFERPPVGYAIGILAAIYDLGIRETPGSSFGPRHQVCLWWELSHRDSKGQQHSLRDVVTMSTMDGSHLASRIEALLGRSMTDTERADFDAGALLGKRCKLLLAVSPKKPDGSPFVKMAMPIEAKDPEIAVEGDYTSIPRFIEKVCSDADRLAGMRKELAAGGGDLVKIAPKGVTVGSRQAPPGAAKIVGQQVAPVPPPPPAREQNSLPPGWTVAQAPNGSPYYIHKDGRTQWDHPGQPTPPPPPPPVQLPPSDDLPF